MAELSAVGGRHRSVCTCGAAPLQQLLLCRVRMLQGVPLWHCVHDKALPDALAHEEDCSLLMSHPTVRARVVMALFHIQDSIALQAARAPLREKPLPGLLDVFGWCTWDAFYSRVSARGEVSLGSLQLYCQAVHPSTKWCQGQEAYCTLQSILCYFSGSFGCQHGFNFPLKSLQCLHCRAA